MSVRTVYALVLSRLVLSVFVWWLWVVVGSVSLFGCVVGMFVWVCLGLCGLVCVGERGTGVCIERASVCTFKNVSVCTGSMPTCFIHVSLVPVHTRTF